MDISMFRNHSHITHISSIHQNGTNCFAFSTVLVQTEKYPSLFSTVFRPKKKHTPKKGPSQPSLQPYSTQLMWARRRKAKSHVPIPPHVRRLLWFGNNEEGLCAHWPTGNDVSLLVDREVTRGERGTFRVRYGHGTLRAVCSCCDKWEGNQLF